MKRLVSFIAAVVAIAMLCSCDIEFITDSGDGSATEVQEGASEIAEAPSSREITVGITGFDTYDPLTTASDTVRSVCGFIFEPLFELDPALRRYNVLATDYSVSDDGRMLTVQLRSDVFWHDGSPFTAADVVYTVNCIKRGGTYYDGYLDAISSVQALSNNVFAAYFSRPVPDPALLFTFPIIKNGSANYVSFDPVGTGPFFFDASGSLVASEVYYNGRAGIDRMNISNIPDNN